MVRPLVGDMEQRSLRQTLQRTDSGLRDQLQAISIVFAGKPWVQSRLKFHNFNSSMCGLVVLLCEVGCAIWSITGLETRGIVGQTKVGGVREVVGRASEMAVLSLDSSKFTSPFSRGKGFVFILQPIY